MGDKKYVLPTGLMASLLPEQIGTAESAETEQPLNAIDPHRLDNGMSLAVMKPGTPSRKPKTSSTKDKPC